MTRFFVDRKAFLSDTPVLTGENGKHAAVLRLKAGEQVILCDGAGSERLCRILSSSSSETVLEAGEIHASVSEPRVKVSVYMAYPKADKLEHVIQKATELGAAEIVAFPSARCVSRPEEKSLGKKHERWQRIAQSAAEQSGRGRIPEVVLLGSWREALNRAKEADLGILFYENEHALTLSQALNAGSYGSVSLLSGPEGGLEEREVEEARNAGLTVCTLGNRILRCETAPLCALSAVMYAAGEF
ncbi:MAG: RsmE family RNA methyltransferase [Faecousia sp.]